MTDADAMRKIKSANLLHCSVVVHTLSDAQHIRDMAGEFNLALPRIVQRPLPQE
jgi:hypothetical protein